MLKTSEVPQQPKAVAPAPAPVKPVPPAAPAPARGVDPAQIAQIQAAVGQMASSMQHMATGIAALKPVAPVTAMNADVVRDDKGRMTSVRVTIIRN
jgi:hypothetical protein